MQSGSNYQTHYMYSRWTTVMLVLVYCFMWLSRRGDGTDPGEARGVEPFLGRLKLPQHYSNEVSLLA